jgi:hypothetical protein
MLSSQWLSMTVAAGVMLNQCLWHVCVVRVCCTCVVCCVLYHGLYRLPNRDWKPPPLGILALSVLPAHTHLCLATGQATVENVCTDHTHWNLLIWRAVMNKISSSCTPMLVSCPVQGCNDLGVCLFGMRRCSPTLLKLAAICDVLW